MRVLVADDHPLIVAGVRTVLEQDEAFTVVGEAHSGSDVLPLVGRLDPDLVLLDMRLPGMDGMGCLTRIRERHPDVKVVVLSAVADSAGVEAALAEGACGYVLKTVDPDALLAAIHQSVEGEGYHPLQAADCDGADEATELTPREQTILEAVTRGLSNQAIAKELWVTEQTIKFHLTNIYRKLGVSNRTEAALWRLRQTS
jgi:DNA-binding NarL/FixJ family response regulator